MKKLLLSAVGLVALGMTTPASAADLAARPYVKAAPAMVDPYLNWSGFYLGGQIGYAGSRSSYTLSQLAGTESFSFDPSSAIGGGHLGLQGQWGSWVLGVEGTYNVVSLKQTDIAVLLPGRLRSISTRDIATVVGKVGYASGPWMVYVKGGWADANIDTFAINPATGVFGDVNAWQSGYTVGGGIDYMFVRNWIAGVDFNYYDFRFNRNSLASDGVTLGNTKGKNEVYAGMFRLSYLFNWGGGPIAARY